MPRLLRASVRRQTVRVGPRQGEGEAGGQLHQPPSWTEAPEGGQPGSPSPVLGVCILKAEVLHCSS